MKVVEIKHIGGPDVLDCVDRPKPQRGPGEVLVRAHAIGVNYFDLMIRTGRYLWMPALPYVMGNDMTGWVEAIGPGVQKTMLVGEPVRS